MVPKVTRHLLAYVHFGMILCVQILYYPWLLDTKTLACFVTPLIGWTEPQLVLWRPWLVVLNSSSFVMPLIGRTEPQLVLWRPWLVGQEAQLVLWRPWLVGQNPSLFCDAPDWLVKTQACFLTPLIGYPACFVTPLIGWTKSPACFPWFTTVDQIFRQVLPAKQILRLSDQP